jgi:hypothetical protein
MIRKTKRVKKAVRPRRAPRIAVEASNRDMKESDTSPWLSAWFSPIKTIRNVLKNEKNLKIGLYPLAFFFGFNALISRANVWHSGDRYPLIGILLVALLAAFQSAF